MGKGKQFDIALAVAKSFLTNNKVTPAKLKLAAGLFKADPVLSKAFTDLYNLTLPDAKQVNAEKSTVKNIKINIDNAKTVDELKAIAREIQTNKTLSDAQVSKLDDLVFIAIDKLDALVS